MAKSQAATLKAGTLKAGTLSLEGLLHPTKKIKYVNDDHAAFPLVLEGEFIMLMSEETSRDTSYPKAASRTP